MDRLHHQLRRAPLALPRWNGSKSTDPTSFLTEAPDWIPLFATFLRESIVLKEQSDLSSGAFKLLQHSQTAARWAGAARRRGMRVVLFLFHSLSIDLLR